MSKKSTAIELMNELLDDPELMKSIVEEYLAEQQLRYASYESFYESHAFFEMLGWIRINEETVDYESVAYHPMEYPFDCSQFQLLWDSVVHFNPLVQEDDCSFPTAKVEYRDMEFGIMHGQGSHIWIKVL